jgi:hypothetical protein
MESSRRASCHGDWWNGDFQKEVQVAIEEESKILRQWWITAVTKKLGMMRRQTDRA